MILYRPYIPNQTLLFPSRIDEDIAANDLVRFVSALVDSLDLSRIKALYKESSRSENQFIIDFALFPNLTDTANPYPFSKLF